MSAPTLTTTRRAELRYEIAKVIADARDNQSPNETAICFEAAERILSLTLPESR